jgi:hypothetical protein
MASTELCTAAVTQMDTSAEMSEVNLNSRLGSNSPHTWQEMIDAVVKSGGEYKSLHAKLTTIFNDDLKKDVGELKMFVWKVSKGVAGVRVNVNGTTMDWVEFTKFAFDVTPHRLNQLLDLKDHHASKPTDREKKDWVKMQKADYDKALNEQWNKGVMSAGLKPEEVVRKLMDAEDEYWSYRERAAYAQGVRDAQSLGPPVSPEPEPTNNKEPERKSDTRKAKSWHTVGDDSRSLGIGSKNDLRAQGKRQHAEPPQEESEGEPVKLSPKDPYAYYEQFKDEPQTMASELAAMLLEFRMDEQQTTTLLDLLKKQLKAQRKALAA